MFKYKLLLSLLALLFSCRDSKIASRNISYKADNFEIERRIVFYNGITDTYMLTIQGFCSIKSDGRDNQLEVTCKTNTGNFVKHYLGISDNVTYFVEHLEEVNVSTSRYKILFKPSVIIPDVEIK